jgi:7,8-dihydropterin-6-yl-methyl-4-(beta-D-ribofuranosyl)aminobenzene 5'-phosphate synthase
VILDDLFYVSGEIPRVTAFETGMHGQHRRTEDGQGWEPGSARHGREIRRRCGQGQGCRRLYGVLPRGSNQRLIHARDCFPGLALHAVLGGLHLSGANERVIPETVAALRAFDLKTIAAAHCTGWGAAQIGSLMVQT